MPLGEAGGHKMTLLLPTYLVLMLDDILKTSLFFQIQKLKVLVLISPCKWIFSTPRVFELTWLLYILACQKRAVLSVL